MSWTNRGKNNALAALFRGASLPTNFYLALVTSATAPGADTNVMSDLTQIATGNGYTDGGYQLSLNSTDFDTLTEDDTDDQADILCKDITWTASSGPIPASGNGARYVVMTDDNATVASREVWQYWSLGADRTVSDGQPLTLQDLKSSLLEPA